MLQPSNKQAGHCLKLQTTASPDKLSPVRLKNRHRFNLNEYYRMNAHLQNKFKISLDPISVAESFTCEEIDPKVVALLHKLDEIRKTDVPDQTALEFQPSAAE
jgi:hypothetical protein